MTPQYPPVTEPEILEMPPQKMAAVYAKGRPDRVLAELVPTLVNSLYALKFEASLTGGPPVPIGCVRARFPDAHLLPVEEWTNVIGLPVPEDTRSLPQPVGGAAIRLETWEYGTVAQISHRSEGDHGETAAERLQEFIRESGHEIIGVHEEEYHTREDNRIDRTVIRYRVRTK